MSHRETKFESVWLDTISNSQEIKEDLFGECFTNLTMEVSSQELMNFASYVNNDDATNYNQELLDQDMSALSPVDVSPDMVVSSVSHGQGGEIPAFANWPGDYNFNVTFDQQFEKPTKNTTWTYSDELDKLYVITQKSCPFKFTTGKHPPEGSIIRALPMYSRAEHMADIVQRCPNHSSPTEVSNIDQVAPPSHLVRCDISTADYKTGTNGRLSVIVPYELPQAGTDHTTYLYKFMCYSSCVGGLNRRPIQLIFTLESNGEVLGRRSVKVRICACPGRDRKSDEKRKQGRCMSRQASFTRPSTSGKRKALPMDEVYHVPIRGKENYELLLKMAEALELRSLISPEQIEAYRADRLRLNDGGNRNEFIQNATWNTTINIQQPLNQETNVISLTKKHSSLTSNKRLRLEPTDHSNSANISREVANNQHCQPKFHLISSWLQEIGLIAYADTFYKHGYILMNHLDNVTYEDFEPLKIGFAHRNLLWEKLVEFRTKNECFARENSQVSISSHSSALKSGFTSLKTKQKSFKRSHFPKQHSF